MEGTLDPFSVRDQPGDPTFYHEKTLLQYGLSFRCVTPKKRTNLPLDEPICFPSPVDNSIPIKKAHKPVSKDAIANKLASKFGCDVVLSSSTFSALTNCYSLSSDSWEIPFVVRSSLPSEGGTTPLSHQNKVDEKNDVGENKSGTTENETEAAEKKGDLQDSESVEIKTEADEGNGEKEDKNDIDGAENRDSASNIESPSEHTISTGDSEEKCPSVNNSGNTNDNSDKYTKGVESNQPSTTDTETENSNESNAKDAEIERHETKEARPRTNMEIEKRKIVFIDKPLLKHNLSLREKNEMFAKFALEKLFLDRSDPKKLEPSSIGEIDSDIKKETEDVTDDNLTYNTWSFGDIRILTRCKLHGFVEETINNKRVRRYVGVKAKTEYGSVLPNNPNEEIIVCETASWWAYSFIRPAPVIVLGRVDVINNSIKKIEYLTKHDILPKNCVFRPKQACKLLHVILQTLRSLDCGEYLLVHKKGSPHICIYRHTQAKEEATQEKQQEQQKQRKTYDLYATHEAKKEEKGSEEITYIPFCWDSSRSPQQIPCTFPLRPVSFSHKIVPGVAYCHAFAHTGSCPKDNCSWPHLHEEDVHAIKLRQPVNYSLNNKKKRMSRKGKSQH